ncbi:MAG: GNAT family N-acetyltransferase, partial [Verrucomicrobiales bacterium]
MTAAEQIFTLVDRENVVELMYLSVRDDEKHLISPTARWLAQAPHVEESQTYGIFYEGTAVGLISIIDPLLASAEDQQTHYQSNCLYIWRLMIDRAYRGQGHGRAAIRFALQLARDRGNEGISLTTMDQRSGNALP